jgi:hypothetical protein
MPRLSVGGTPSAALSPRAITSYVPRYGIAALVALPVVSAALAIWYAGIPLRPRFGLSDESVMIEAAVAGAVVAIVAGLAMRAIVRRPQPAVSDALVDLDDAFRSSSLHALNGAAVTLELLLLAFLLGETQGALSITGLHPRLEPFLTLFMLVAMGMAVASWAILGHPLRWRTRRPGAGVGLA